MNACALNFMKCVFLFVIRCVRALFPFFLQGGTRTYRQLAFVCVCI